MTSKENIHIICISLLFPNSSISSILIDTYHLHSSYNNLIFAKGTFFLFNIGEFLINAGDMSLYLTDPIWHCWKPPPSKGNILFPGTSLKGHKLTSLLFTSQIYYLLFLINSSGLKMAPNCCSPPHVFNPLTIKMTFLQPYEVKVVTSWKPYVLNLHSTCLFELVYYPCWSPHLLRHVLKINLSKRFCFNITLTFHL